MECGGEGEGGVQEDFQLSSLSKWVDGGGRDEPGTRGRAGASRQRGPEFGPETDHETSKCGPRSSQICRS